MATTIEKLITRVVDTFAGQTNQTPPREATLIIGASDGPRLLAGALAKSGFPVTIVESDLNLCRVASELSFVEVVCGDPSDVDFISQAAAKSIANVIVATASDELNLAVCKAVEMTLNPVHLIAVVNEKANRADFEVMGYEVMSIARAALTLLGTAELTSEICELLRTDDDEVLVQLSVTSPVAIGRHLSSLLLSEVDLVDLSRQGHSMSIDESTYFQIGDVITVFGKTRAVEAASAELNPRC